MMGRILRAARLLGFIICAVMIFVACEPVDKVIEFFSDDGTGHIFKIALENDPENLDPQLANDESSVVIAKNLYAGLMDYDENGKLVGKMADDYVISADGLTYTFYIKDGYKWHALGNYEAPVTAHDFVFGFRRLMDPKTASPHSEKYYCIKNAEAARNGSVAPSEIGVEAIDDRTLQFTLEYQNAEFLYLLAELPSMPCCEDFFNSAGGKYGLEAEAVCSNGPFFVRYWLHDPYGKNNYVRIRRNPGYSDMSFVAPSGVNFLITPNADERRTDFTAGDTDAIIYPSGTFAAVDGEGYIAGYADVAGIVFNEKSGIFSDVEVRQVFSWAIDRELIANNSPDILLRADGMIPASPTLTAKGYSQRIPEDVSVTNIPMAEYKWGFLLTERQKSSLIGMSIMVPSDFGYADYLTALTDSWYSVFGTHISVDIATHRDYAERLKSGDYDIALAVIGSSTGDAVDYIKPFGRAREFGISISEVISAENGVGHYDSMTALNFACTEGENAVLSAYHFIPLWQLPSVCCYDDDCEGIRFDAFSKTAYFEIAKSF